MYVRYKKASETTPDFVYILLLNLSFRRITVEKHIEIEAFLKTIKQKNRILTYTSHSLDQAKQRGIIENNDNRIKIFETDVLEKEPNIVVEQNCENQEERKFKTYYKSDALGGFMC